MPEPLKVAFMSDIHGVPSALKRLECGLTIFNPGSVSLPKGGSSRSFGYFDGDRLCHITF